MILTIHVDSWSEHGDIFRLKKCPSIKTTLQRERERLNNIEQSADCRLTHIPVMFSSHMGRGQTPVKCGIYEDHEKLLSTEL